MGSKSVTGGRAGKRALAASLAAHILHDGYTDLLYVLLPVWQTELTLSLAQVGFLKSTYSAVMASLQFPAGLLAEKLGERALLAAGIRPPVPDAFAAFDILAAVFVKTTHFRL